MKFSTFTVLLIWATLSIAGLAFLPLLRVQWQPSHTLPSITVSYQWQNVSGRVIEQEVTSLLEGALNRAGGISRITSSSRNNGGYITVDFDRNADMDAARFEVASILRQIYPRLPEGVSFPALSLNRPDNSGERALLAYSLQASANPAGILMYAEEQIKPVLAQVDGVDRIVVSGAAPYEWMIEYDAVQLDAIGFTPAMLQQAVAQYYREEPVGVAQVDNGNGSSALMQVTSASRNLNRTRLEEIPLQMTEGRRIIRLGDVAAVRHIETEPASYYRINGMNRINIVIYAASQANHIVLAQQVRAKLGELQHALPKGYSILSTYDSTEYISEELNKIYVRTIATICILLLFILIVTRKFRFMAIILLSILANIFIALGMYYLLRIEIHLYSLAGIAISLGLIIDNTIVMVEHIRSRGNRRVFVAILAATLTTAISLSAVFFLDERIRIDLVDFAVVVIINLMVSLTSAWFLTPALYGKIAPASTKPVQRRKVWKIFRKRRMRRGTAMTSRIYTAVISAIRRRQWIAWTAFVLGFGLPVFMLPAKIESTGKWAELYNRTLGSETYIETVKPAVDRILGGSLRLFVQFVYEGSQWNTERERTTLNVYAYMPPGATIMQMNQAIEQLEGYLSRFSEIDRFETAINSGQNGWVNITFKKEHENGAFPYFLRNSLITWSINSGAADWQVSGIGDGFSNRMYESNGTYRVQLFGYNFDDLYGHAESIRQELLGNARIKEVNLMSRYTWEKHINSEFTLTPDIDRLAMSGISLPAYFSMVRNAAGNEQTAAATMMDGSYQYIKYRAKQLAETDRWTMNNSLMHAGDTYLKLSATGEMVKDIEQMEICKENQQYTMTVSYDYVGSARVGARLLERIVDKANDTLPLGYRAESSGGYSWWQQEKSQYWMILLILAVMYVLCAILFESLWKPLAVISLVPFAFIGLFLTFYIFQLNFDQGGFAALDLLRGLTVNAAIYNINDFNNLKKSRCSQRRRYMQALHGKITPVMLTILSTILGLIPFVYGEHREPFWFALAAGTMGGLLFSLVGILFFLPLFFFRKTGKRANKSNIQLLTSEVSTP